MLSRPPYASDGSDLLQHGNHRAADGPPARLRVHLGRVLCISAEHGAVLRGTTPLPATDDSDASPSASLLASITYSYTLLTRQTRRLPVAVSLFHGIADENPLAVFSVVEGLARPTSERATPEPVRPGGLANFGITAASLIVSIAQLAW